MNYLSTKPLKMCHKICSYFPNTMNELPLINPSFCFQSFETGQEQTVYNSASQYANLSFLPSSHMIHMALQKSLQISAKNNDIITDHQLVVFSK